MLAHLLASLCLAAATVSAVDLDRQWQTYLDTPPAQAIDIVNQLGSRADNLVAQIGPQNATIEAALAGGVDVVISGGGNLDGYYLGVRMVLSRLPGAKIMRHAGASAGGMFPFEVKLKGETLTAQHHFAYALMEEQNPSDFSNEASASMHQDHHWRQMAPWMLHKWVDKLPSLDGNVFVALSCLAPLPKLIVVSNFTMKDNQAEHAFMGTGTLAEWYDGMLCSDGGAESGPNMTPLFQDKLRPQLIVNIMHTGFPESIVAKYNTTQYRALVERGQDETIEFLKTGAVKRVAGIGSVLTFCPRDAKVDTNVCGK